MSDPLSAPIPLGVDARTGEFLTLDAPQLAATLDVKKTGDRLGASVFGLKQETFGVVGGDAVAKDLKQSGWSIMFGSTVSDEIKKALEPLIEHRRRQVGKDKLFKIFSDYQAEQTATQWLFAPPRGVTMQPVDPFAGVPYYILIVASPEEIPFEFQYELDLFWAVGRLWFDNPGQFAAYAKSVIAYETADKVETPRELALFGTRHELDPGATMIAHNVFDPWIERELGSADKFALRDHTGEKATRAKLGSILAKPPAILFCGGHGLQQNQESEDLAATQGALICRDWPVKDAKGKGVPAEPKHYFAASDIPAKADLQGMMVFLYACYGAGYPAKDDFEKHSNGKPLTVAPKPGISALPQQLLAHGALAVLGHIDKAHGYSVTRGGTPQNQSFLAVLVALMQGLPIGHATDQLNLRWSVMSALLTDGVKGNRLQGTVTDNELATLWAARNDVRNYVVLGDPAVHLRIDKM